MVLPPKSIGPGGLILPDFLPDPPILVCKGQDTMFMETLVGANSNDYFRLL